MKMIKDYNAGLAWLPTMSKRAMSWDDAKRYAERKGFRLPTRKELKTLGVNGKYPTIAQLKTKGFINIKQWIWANDEQSTTYAFYVYLAYGSSGYSDKTYNYYVACVRNISKYAMEGNDGD